MKPDIEEFRTAVYSIVAIIPYGKVLSYGQIAWLVGYPQHSRLVGKVLHNTHTGLPCHRVVNCQGRTVPNWKGQIELLKSEGVIFKRDNYVDMKSSNWNPINNNDSVMELHKK
ncbi:MAG: MGMT family protein [Bacteroidetes bacterium]|uniref:MGMT family protein n=1 Tax=Candidatus Limisoma faecipullorum TaxID=2840854 RepID=A0A9D9IR10_9BACT|nr:MGMT family protein [Candidatus Limisoma faecipullorum]